MINKNIHGKSKYDNNKYVQHAKEGGVKKKERKEVIQDMI
jgi:hypothetical protein